MSKELCALFGAVRYNPKRWNEFEKRISEIKGADFINHSAHRLRAEEIPLFMAMSLPHAQLAGSIIEKNHIAAAKAIDIDGYTALNHAMIYLKPDEALKIVTLLIPYMTKEAIISRAVDGYSFLHRAEGRHYYEVASCISPSLFNLILKNSGSHAATLVKFFYEARRVLDIEIAIHPEIADNYFRKGIILQSLNKPEKAAKYYQKAIELDPSYLERERGVDCATNEDRAHSNITPDILKSQIAVLTKEMNDLAGKLTQLNSKLKTIEEHKGEGDNKMPEVPPYREEDALDHPEHVMDDIVLTGVSCDITFHA